MRTQKVDAYNSRPTSGVSNEYPTPAASFKQPALHIIQGVRNSGKSYLASQILEQAHRDKTFDVVYIITPSFLSNKAYFGKYIREEDVFEPTRGSVEAVIQRVEADRDEWEAFLQQQKQYEQYRRKIHSNDLLGDHELLAYWQHGFLQGSEPKWKYGKPQAPRSLLILDDVLGSPAISQSSGLTRIATLNRHIAPLKEAHSHRSACGLGCMILTQTYRMQSGLGRALRENVSLLTVFKNKQEKQLDVIRDELASVVDVELFNKAYEYATKERFGNLTVDFAPKKPEFQFRKNLNEFIIF